MMPFLKGKATFFLLCPMSNEAVSLNVGKQRRMGVQRPRLDYTPGNKQSLSLANANKASTASV